MALGALTSTLPLNPAPAPAPDPAAAARLADGDEPMNLLDAGASRQLVRSAAGLRQPGDLALDDFQRDLQVGGGAGGGRAVRGGPRCGGVRLACDWPWRQAVC